MSFNWTETPTADVWVSNAVHQYCLAYTFREIGEEQMHLIRKEREWVKAHIPSEYKKGVFILAEGRGWCGEDIYSVDGEIQHILHVRCLQCKRYGLVIRAGVDWCTHCQGFEDLRGET